MNIKNATWGVYLRPECLRMLFLGFSAGLPLLLVIGTLSFWLREAGVDLKTIGFFSWIGLVYGFKWVWSPLVDRLRLPVLHRLLGRRRSWLLAAQSGLVVSLALIALMDPTTGLVPFVAFALLTAFCSATQDIALDAFRIESAAVREQGALAAMYQAGYRLGMIWSGAGALAIAAWAAGDRTGYVYEAWRTSYLVMSASVVVGLAAVLVSREPPEPEGGPAPAGGFMERFNANLAAPFRDFFSRYGRFALLLLAVIATYRISDVVMGVMANPFYTDMGFTKGEVASVTKVFGVLMTLLGAFLGGAVVLRIGVMRTMMIGAVLSAATNLLFSVLAGMGHNLVMLVFTVSADNLAAGLASSAFIAFLSGLTNKAFSATQYAILSSLMLLLPKFLAGFSGALVEGIGYGAFFVFTASLGIPVCLLVWLTRKSAPEGALSDEAVKRD